MSKIKPKIQTLREHTTKRLRERYGLKYTQLLHDTLLNHVYSQKASLVCKQSNRVSVFDTVYDVRESDIYSDLTPPGPTRIRFAYDGMRKTLITVLSVDMNPSDVAVAIAEDEE